MNKKRIVEILSDETENDFPSKVFNIFIMVLILLNVIAVILGTVKSFSSKYESFLYYFELFSVIIFSIEYALRVWTCTAIEKYSHPMKGRFRFIISPFAIIDLLAILPFYIPFLIKIDLRGLRILRLFRMFRLFKMGRYLESLRLIAFVLRSKKEELVLSVVTMILLLLLSSSLLYVVESDIQPESFGSIPAAMWWGTAALTTVGYGDVYPVTTTGRILAAIIAIMGIGMFALPAGILASGFSEALAHRSNTKKINVTNQAIKIAKRLKSYDIDIKEDLYSLLTSMIDIDGIRDESEKELLKKIDVIFSEQRKE